MISAFFRDRSGATAIEYGLIAGLIAVALIGVLGLTSGAITKQFTRISTTVNAAGL